MLLLDAIHRYIDVGEVPGAVVGVLRNDQVEPSQGPKLTRVTIKKRYTGPLEGTGIAAVLTAQGADGSAYVASERVEGTLAGRTDPSSSNTGHRRGV